MDDATFPHGNENGDETPADPSRRKFLGLAPVGVLGAGLVEGRAAAASNYWPRRTRFHRFDERHLAVQQIGGGETLHLAFRTADRIIDGHAVDQLSFLFRDWRDHDSGVLVDVRLFDLLASIQTLLTATVDRPTPLILHSGYRTPERNRTLEGAAVHSQHIVGRAADISADRASHDMVARAAEIAGAHGLGRYDAFTHVDVGPPGRRWRG